MFCEGKAYREWLELAIRYMEQVYPNDKETKRFSDIAQNADGKFLSVAERLIGILEAVDAISSKPKESSIPDLIKKICNNIYRFELSMRRRHAGRSRFEINDEYDLQDALRSILALFINDIRPEEYVPSYAGGKSRVDFLLPEHGIIIETKMASKSLKDKDIGDQLVIDFQHYKSLPNCDHLICLVYDKDINIANSSGLITDLEKMSDNDMKITVLVSPMI